MENPMRTWLFGTALSLLLWGPAAFAGTVLIVGDSISAAFGMDTRQGWVALLEERLAEHQPKLVIIELGGNDGLRGQPPAQLQQNLAAMVQQSQKIGAKVLILGMQLPPNYGVRYTTAFAAVFPKVADEYATSLVPFALEGIGGVPSMMQSDGIHPTAQAQPKLLDNVWPVLKPLL
jgi:acyl-CoA thioesterase-1